MAPGQPKAKTLLMPLNPVQRFPACAESDERKEAQNDDNEGVPSVGTCAPEKCAEDYSKEGGLSVLASAIFEEKKSVGESNDDDVYSKDVTQVSSEESVDENCYSREDSQDISVENDDREDNERLNSPSAEYGFRGSANSSNSTPLSVPFDAQENLFAMEGAMIDCLRQLALPMTPTEVVDDTNVSSMSTYRCNLCGLTDTKQSVIVDHMLVRHRLTILSSMQDIDRHSTEYFKRANGDALALHLQDLQVSQNKREGIINEEVKSCVKQALKAGPCVWIMHHIAEQHKTSGAASVFKDNVDSFAIDNGDECNRENVHCNSDQVTKKKKKSGISLVCKGTKRKRVSEQEVPEPPAIPPLSSVRALGSMNIPQTSAPRMPVLPLVPRAKLSASAISMGWSKPPPPLAFEPQLPPQFQSMPLFGQPPISMFALSNVDSDINNNVTSPFVRPSPLVLSNVAPHVAFRKTSFCSSMCETPAIAARAAVDSSNLMKPLPQYAVQKCPTMFHTSGEQIISSKPPIKHGIQAMNVVESHKASATVSHRLVEGDRAVGVVLTRPIPHKQSIDIPGAAATPRPLIHV